MIVEHPFTAGGCKNFSVADDGLSRGVTSIMSLDLLGNTFSFDADHIVSNWSTVYASTLEEDLGPPRHDAGAEVIANDAEIRVVLPEHADGRDVSQQDASGGQLVQTASS